MKIKWIILLLILIVAGSVTSVYIFTNSRVEILAGELRIASDYEEIGLYPAKIKIKDLPDEYKLKYKIVNYGNETVDIMIYNKVPDKLSDGYERFEEGSEIFLVIPEERITIEGGDTYKTEVLLGLSAELEDNTEIWIGFKSLREQYSLELSSRILLERGKEQ